MFFNKNWKKKNFDEKFWFWWKFLPPNSQFKQHYSLEICFYDNFRGLVNTFLVSSAPWNITLMFLKKKFFDEKLWFWWKFLPPKSHLREHFRLEICSHDNFEGLQSPQNASMWSVTTFNRKNTLKLTHNDLGLSQNNLEIELKAKWHKTAFYAKIPEIVEVEL